MDPWEEAIEVLPVEVDAPEVPRRTSSLFIETVPQPYSPSAFTDDKTFTKSTRHASLSNIDTELPPHFQGYQNSASLLLIVHKIQLYTPKEDVYFKVMIADQKRTYDDKATNGEPLKNGALYHYQHCVEFPVTDHSLRFGSLGIEVYSKRTFQSDLLIGSTDLRLNKFEFERGKHSITTTVPILEKSNFSHHLGHSPFSPYAKLGELDLSLGIYQNEGSPRAETAKRRSNLILDFFIHVPIISSATRDTFRQLYHITLTLFQGMDRISIPAQVYGLVALLKFHEQVEPDQKYILQDDASQFPVEKSKFLQSASWYSKYATAAYGWKHMLFFLQQFNMSNQQSIRNHLPHLRKEDMLVMHFGNGTVFQPNYYMVHDRIKEVLVLSVRGTLSATDNITDLICEFAPFQNGLAHGGMKLAAEWLMERAQPQIQEHCERLGLKRVVIVGHSLGAGIAVLCCMLFKPWSDAIDWECYAYAPPHIVSASLSNNSRIHTFVRNRDLVPRLCYGSVQDLRDCFLAAISHTKNHATEVAKLIAANSNSAEVQSLLDKIKKKRDYLLEKNVNPKLTHGGKVYFMENVRPASAASKGGLLKLFGKKQKRTLLQCVDPMFLRDFLIKDSMYTDHMPLCYENMLQRLSEDASDGSASDLILPIEP